MQKKPNKKESLSGVPYHVTYLKMDDFDTARHKSRCIYYRKKGNHCNIKNEACIGSSHCSCYKEDPNKSKVVKEVPKNKKATVHKQIQIYKSIPCSIPLSTKIITKEGKLGVLIKYENCLMTLDINGNKADFYYPMAFDNGYLQTTKMIEKCIQNDKKKAIRK